MEGVEQQGGGHQVPIALGIETYVRRLLPLQRLHARRHRGQQPDHGLPGRIPRTPAHHAAIRLRPLQAEGVGKGRLRYIPEEFAVFCGQRLHDQKMYIMYA